jgi:hypothetical protein
MAVASAGATFLRTERKVPKAYAVSPLFQACSEIRAGPATSIAAMTERGAEGGSAAERRRRLVGAIAAAALVGVALVLALVGGGGGDDAAEAFESLPHFVDVSDVVELEGSSGHEIYWAGQRPATKLELSSEAEGNVYLRYLPPGTEAGDPNAGFLTIGTYPVPGPVGALRRTAAKLSSSLGHVGGGVILVNPASRGSVYLAYPGSELQIEVYDPKPGRALELIRSGAIRPVGG